MKTVKISRKRWCRGGGAAALRTDTGQSCCLGFVARAYGLKTPVDVGEFADLAPEQDCSVLPRELRPKKNEISDGYAAYSNTALHDKLVAANDDVSEKMRGAAREEKIAKLLAKAGIKAVFVD